MNQLEKIVKLLQDNASEDFYYELNKQRKRDVEKYFKEKLKCKYLPKGFLEFYQQFDGGRIGLLEIYTTRASAESFENSSRLSDWKPDDINLDEVVEFAIDGCGDSFYFYKNKKDDKIYYWSHEVKPETFTSFNTWLEEQTKIEINISKDV